MSNQVNLSSMHEVKQWIEERKATGQFKHCIHLTIGKRVYGRSRFDAQEQFLPNCNRASFQWTVDTCGDRNYERDILAELLHRDPIRCPAKCALYESVRWAVCKRSLSRAGQYPVAPFQWFGRLSWQIQLALIVLFIVALTPKWVPQIVILLKAFHGQ